jgi:hypothetical protein
MSNVRNTTKNDPLINLFAGLNIPAQEAQGQLELINAQQLPSKYRGGDATELYTKMGIGIIGPSEGDKLFFDVVLPPGWKKERTDHSMWNNLRDDKGRLRATFFYKAAFYDRDAFIVPERRYSFNINDYLPEEEKGLWEEQEVEVLNPKWEEANQRKKERNRLRERQGWFMDDEFGHRYHFLQIPKYIKKMERVFVRKYKNPYLEYNNTPIQGFVLDGKEIIFQTEKVFFTRKYRKDRHNQWWKAYDELKDTVKQQCLEYLNTNYPHWSDFSAYWE